MRGLQIDGPDHQTEHLVGRKQLPVSTPAGPIILMFYKWFGPIKSEVVFSGSGTKIA
jgi:hypothetical protein